MKMCLIKSVSKICKLNQWWPEDEGTVTGNGLRELFGSDKCYTGMIFQTPKLTRILFYFIFLTRILKRKKN